MKLSTSPCMWSPGPRTWTRSNFRLEKVGQGQKNFLCIFSVALHFGKLRRIVTTVFCKVSFHSSKVCVQMNFSTAGQNFDKNWQISYLGFTQDFSIGIQSLAIMWIEELIKALHLCHLGPGQYCCHHGQIGCQRFNFQPLNGIFLQVSLFRPWYWP